MLQPKFDPAIAQTNFILTGISQEQDAPRRWGFEVFTSDWRRLAHFTYASEPEAAWAVANFGWVMGRICAVSVSPSLSAA